MTNDQNKMKASKAESIKEAIMKAIETNDLVSAMELIEHWDSQFPLEDEGKTIFLLTKLEVLLKRYELNENAEERVRVLSEAIKTGNDLFAANEGEGFPMDSEVQLMWFRLIDCNAELISFFYEDAYDGDEDKDEDEDDCWDSDDCFEERQPDIISEAIQARIGRINRPNFKPKPPRKYDDSLKSRLLRAVDRHFERFGDFDIRDWNLMEKICESLDIDIEDFHNSIYE